MAAVAVMARHRQVLQTARDIGAMRTSMLRVRFLKTLDDRVNAKVFNMHHSRVSP